MEACVEGFVQCTYILIPALCSLFPLFTLPIKSFGGTSIHFFDCIFKPLPGAAQTPDRVPEEDLFLPFAFVSLNSPTRMFVFSSISAKCYSPEEESTSSMASGLLRSFCDQTAYCRSLYLLKPVVKRRPVSPRYTTCNAMRDTNQTVCAIFWDSERRNRVHKLP